MYYLKSETSLKKNLLVTILFLCTAFVASAKNYYFSSSGSDSYTSTQAQSSATPWKTISKLNSVFSSLVSGDSVLFKRGEIFYGTITPSVSGIIFSAYGTGTVKPVISGLTAVTTWTSAGTNLWKSNAISPAKAPCMLLVNDVAVAYGRYPNTGYNYFETHSGTTSITDNELPASPSFTGGEVVIRINGYELNRHPISAHSGTAITFTGNSKTIKDNYGYFIQNHLSALDLQNEWCYDNTAKTITIYGTAPPTNVKVSTVEYLVNISGTNNLTFKDLAFEGANHTAIKISNASNITVDGCDIRNSGVDAVAGSSVSGSLFQNCKLYNSYDNGFDMGDPLNSGITIRNNSINKSGAVQGMGGSGSGFTMHGIAICGTTINIENNTIDSSGSSAITFRRGSSQTIKNNVVNTYCFVKHDGGGVYTWNNDVVPVTYTNNKIIGNIILNGIGAPEGTPNLNNRDVDGIMMDDNAGNITITDNTVANVAGKGIYIHNSFNMTVLRNTVFNCGDAQVDFTHNLAYINGTVSPYTTPLRNITFKNNILVSKADDYDVMNVSTIRNDIDSVGTVDSNYYARPINDEWTINAYRTVSGSSVSAAYNVSGWKTAFKWDKASKKSARGIAPYTLNSLAGSSLVTNGQFLSDISGVRVYSSNSNQTLSWDNTSKLTSGGSLKVAFPSVINTVYTLLYSSVGAVSSTKNYILRFSTLGTTDTGMMRVYLRLEGSPYTTLAPVQVKTFGKNKTDFEFLFSTPIAASAAVYAIELKQSSGTTYIDNIAFYEANVTVTNPDSKIRFEYNPTNTTKTVTLDGNYISVDSVFYSNTLTLQPYSSKVLIKDTGTIQTVNYTLTTTATPTAGGTITKSPSATSYASGTVVTLTAAAASGYVFTGWSGDVTSTATSVTVTMSSNKSVTANFVPVYTLTTTATPTAGGTIAVSPTATSYTSGTVVTLTATAASGYVFTGWSGDVTGTSSSVTVTMNANKTVTANFAVVASSYTLTTTATPIAGGTIAKSPSATTYASGTVVTLTATAASGYVFTGWSGDATGTAASVTVTMSSNKSVTANFAVATSYTLTATATPTAGGSVGKSPNTTTYSPGTVVTLTATAASGYVFTGWSGDATGTSASVTVTMNSNKTVTANFAPLYTLTTTATPTAGGSVAKSPSATSYASGTVVTLTATAASGYIFTGWSGDATGTSTSVTVTMNANKTVTANFALSYTLTTTATPTAGGTIVKSPSATTYASGTVVTLTATAASGYVFTGWSGDAAGTSASVTVIMNANKTVTANFAAATSYTLTTTATPTAGGTITKSPNTTTYTPGTVVTLTATAASGYIFTGWSGDVTGTSTSATVTMSSNKTVTANFALAYALTVYITPSVGGTVVKSPNAATYASGTVVTVTAVPASGYVFTGWSLAASGTSPTASVTLNGNKSVTATFAPAFTLTTTATPAAGGSITRGPNAISYSSGTAVTLTATPASGYIFTGWSGDVTGTSTSASVTMNANKSVTANFQATSTTIRIDDDVTGTSGLCTFEGSISSNSGASNGKVVNLTNSTGKGVNWNVNVPSAGTYTLSWRYVNSSTSNTYTMKLLINGVSVNDALPFPKTSSSSVFDTTTTAVTLTAGNNDIRLESVASNATADIDWIEVTGNNPVAADCAAARLASTATTTAIDSRLSTSSTALQGKTGIYPNPSNGTINVGFNASGTSKVSISMYFTDGRVYKNLFTGTVAKGYNLFNYDLGFVIPGIYSVVIKEGNLTPQVYKVMIQQ